jgi:hypothetical protein
MMVAARVDETVVYPTRSVRSLDLSGHRPVWIEDYG